MLEVEERCDNLVAKTNDFFSSKFQCRECGHIIALPRYTARRRKKDHIKHIYCIECKERTEHQELSEMSTMYDRIQSEKN